MGVLAIRYPNMVWGEATQDYKIVCIGYVFPSKDLLLLKTKRIKNRRCKPISPVGCYEFTPSVKFVDKYLRLHELRTPVIPTQVGVYINNCLYGFPMSRE